MYVLCSEKLKLESVPTSVSVSAHKNQRLEIVNLQYKSVNDPRHTISDQDYVISSVPTQDKNNQSSIVNNNTAITSKNGPAIVDNPAYSTSSGPPVIDNPAYIAVKSGPGTTTVSSHYSNI